MPHTPLTLAPVLHAARHLLRLPAAAAAPGPGAGAARAAARSGAAAVGGAKGGEGRAAPRAVAARRGGGRATLGRAEGGHHDLAAGRGLELWASRANQIMRPQENYELLYYAIYCNKRSLDYG